MKISFFIAAFCAAAVFSSATCASSVPRALREWPELSRGDHDITVRALQLLLTARGYRVSADGYFESATEKALKQFQQAHQLVLTGETNEPTWEALAPILHQGSNGPAVRAAQIELRAAGYAVATDGVFGPRMKMAIQRYQRQTGHTPDGVVGNNTWYELLGGFEPGDD